jgi:hypothetical protein
MRSDAQVEYTKLDAEAIATIARYGFVGFAIEAKYNINLTFTSEVAELVRLCKQAA